MDWVKTAPRGDEFHKRIESQNVFRKKTILGFDAFMLEVLSTDVVIE